ncbi:hypothetical protein MXD60_10435 [Frankia sp. AgB32]|nr:hypothetical protein [Frankia sp. AgB32]
MTRLTDITLPAALTARALPPLLARFHPNPSVIPAIRILSQLGTLAGPIRMSRERLDRHGDQALDPIGPLLGDPTAPPLDRALHQVRHRLHHLGEPDALISPSALHAFATLAIGITDRTQLLLRRTASHTRGPARARLDLAGDQTAATTTSWRTVRAFLRETTTRGVDGDDIPALVQATGRLLAASTRIPTNPTRRDLLRALDVMRAATLLLPEIAHRNARALHNLTAHQALLRPASAGTGYEPIGLVEQSLITGAYQTATSHGASTITHLLRLPDPHPHHARALYLVQRHAPSPDHDLLGLPDTNPTSADTARPGGRTPTLTETADGTLRIDDPRHGTLHVDITTLSTAVTHTPEALRTLLAHHPWIDLDGTETLITLAALATIHTPEHLNATAGLHPAPELPSAALPPRPLAPPGDISDITP